MRFILREFMHMSFKIDFDQPLTMEIIADPSNNVA